MMTWEAGAQQKAGQSRRFHHGCTFHVSLDRVVFIGFGGKNGLPESGLSATRQDARSDKATYMVLP